MSVAKVVLGKALFSDQRLSVTGKYSCASCHVPELAFTDGRKTAVGATGELHTRNTPTLINVAYNSSFGWANPELRNLEDQHLVPLLNTEPVEMGLNDENLDGILKTLARDPVFYDRFNAAFPGAEVTLTNITYALASYVRTLIFANAPFDRYVYRDDSTAFSETAKLGMRLFFSDRLKCSLCHASFNFSGPVVSADALETQSVFHNTGLYNLGALGAYPDPGVYAVSGKQKDMGAFRAPSLRNVALTAPYMHDGSINTLEEVVDTYAAGGSLKITGIHKGDGRANPWKRETVSGFEITAGEKEALVAFLRTLTSTRFE